MNMKKTINYKSIFVNDGQKDSMQFKVIGEYIVSDKTMIRLEHEEMRMQIAYKNSDIYLKNNNSMLHLNTDIMVENNYTLAYGSVILVTKVLLFEADESHLKLKYELYQSDALVSTVYILMSMSDVEEEMIVS